MSQAEGGQNADEPDLHRTGPVGPLNSYLDSTTPPLSRKHVRGTVPGPLFSWLDTGPDRPKLETFGDRALRGDNHWYDLSFVVSMASPSGGLVPLLSPYLGLLL